MELALDLSWYWMLRNEHADAASWLAFACSVPGAERPDALRARRGRAGARRAGEPGTFDGPAARSRSRAWARRLPGWASCRGLEARLEPERILPWSAPRSSREVDGAVEDLLELGMASPDRWTRAASGCSAHVAENRGDLERMRADVDVATRGVPGLGDRWGLSSTLSVVGHLRAMDGDLGRSSVVDEARP